MTLSSSASIYRLGRDVKTAWKVGATVANLVMVAFAMTTLAMASAARIAGSRAWVEHSRDVEATIEHMLGALAQAQSAARDYVMARDPKYRALYAAAMGDGRRDAAELVRLTGDNPDQQARARDLAGLLDRKGEFLAGIMARRDVTPRELDEGYALLVRFKAQVADMEEHERRLYRRRDAALSRNINRTYVALAIIMARDLVALVVLAGTAYRAYREATGRRPPAAPSPPPLTAAWRPAGFRPAPGFVCPKCGVARAGPTRRCPTCDGPDPASEI